MNITFQFYLYSYTDSFLLKLETATLSSIYIIATCIMLAAEANPV